LETDPVGEASPYIGTWLRFGMALGIAVANTKGRTSSKGCGPRPAEWCGFHCKGQCY
jgi:hypothetical protein